MATCMGRSRLASTPPSTDSSPIFISTRSILHSDSSLRRIPISFGIALQFTPPSVRKFKADGEKKPYSTNRIDLLARALESDQGAACVFFHRLRRGQAVTCTNTLRRRRGCEGFTVPLISRIKQRHCRRACDFDPGSSVTRL